MIDANSDLFSDIIKLKEAIRQNLAIVRPTAFNKMQLDELKYFLEVYEKELIRLSAEVPSLDTHALSNTIEAKAKYTQHERFNNKNRGL